MSFILFLIIGAIAGWASGELVYGDGFGLVRNIVIGILGALLGGFVFRILGVKTTGLIGDLVMATVGAVLLLFLLNWLG